MDIIIIMGIGILVGRFFVSPKFKNFNERMSLLCTLILIFSMGVMLGQRENFLKDLGSLGMKSFLFFLIPTLFSILLVYMLTKYFMKPSTPSSEKETEKK